MVTSQEIARQNGRIAYGIRPAPLKAPVCNAAPAEEKPMGSTPKKEGEEPVPLYVFLREKAMGMSPEEKRELLNALVEMAEKRKINLGQLIMSIENDGLRFDEMIERVRNV